MDHIIFKYRENVHLKLEIRIKISVNTDILVIGFYGNIGKISVDIF